MDGILILVLEQQRRTPVLTGIQGTDGDDAVSKKLVAFLHHSDSEGSQLRHQDLGRVQDRTSWSGEGAARLSAFLAPEI